MSNLSENKRKEILNFLEELRKENQDSDMLRKINEIELVITEKKYGLIWEKHQENVNQMLIDNFPVFKEVVKNEIISNDSYYNFLLEGDNLHSLILLKKTHFEKIDLIYIDPPYNMGKDDFAYNDTFIGEDDSFRHSKYLSFMSERLNIAYDLLSEKGFIAISIDENEVSQLRLLCNEIFGEENLLSVQHIQVRYANKSLNEKNDWQPVMEYVLIYAKNGKKFKANRPVQEYDIKGFNQEIKELTKGTEEIINDKKVTIFKKGEWKRIKHKEPSIKLLKATWITGSIYSDTGYGSSYKSIVEPRYNVDGYGTLYKVHGLGEDGLGYRYMRNPNSESFTKGEMFTGVPLVRLEEMKTEEGAVKYNPITNLFDYSAEFGNIRQEGGVPFNKGKKPIKMLKEIINYHQNKDAIVLDFFAGSGSTGHATVSLNKDDGGNRRYILCTNNEANIARDITHRRIGNIQKELPHNLKYYKTEFVSKKEIHNDLSKREELLKFVIPLIELEFHLKIDDKVNTIIMSEEQVKQKLNSLENGATAFIYSDIFLTNDELGIAKRKNIKLKDIPEYYFRNELMEVGEL